MKYLGYIVFFLISAGLLIAGDGSAAEVESWNYYEFFGRFHYLALHVPIGVITIAFILEVLVVLKKWDGDKTLRIVDVLIELGA